MTQEELDALMNGDMDLDSLEDESVQTPEAVQPEAEDDIAAETYRASATNHWPPPPTDDNKMVHQLDDVTKESEEKASEIFDIIEAISNDLMEQEETARAVADVIASNVSLFASLSEKFPGISAFQDQLAKNDAALTQANEILETLQGSGDSIMTVMDIMQYQDIHRQKIERVINIMRALSTYMNLLFEGKIDDDQRVGSAVHLPGDSSTDDVVTSDDIEALLDSFGRK